MLQVVGVDKIVSVDLQRPGQGHEACFFDSSVPISTEGLFVDYFFFTLPSPDPEGRLHGILSFLTGLDTESKR